MNRDESTSPGAENAEPPPRAMKATFADKPQPVPGYGGLLAGGGGPTIPVTAEYAGDVRRYLADDRYTPERVWVVTWSRKDGFAVTSETFDPAINRARLTAEFESLASQVCDA